MSGDVGLTAYELLKTGTLVAFRILEEKVLPAHDEAEFGLRLQLKFVADEEEEERDEDEVAENTAEWGSFGFLFALGALSFDEAKPREVSALEYQERDEFKLADFIDGLRYVRGELHFDADYIRGRRVKTRVIVRSNGTVTIETAGRGKAAPRWLERLTGKRRLQLVGGNNA
jgi:hypothetical protein